MYQCVSDPAARPRAIAGPLGPTPGDGTRGSAVTLRARSRSRFRLVKAIAHEPPAKLATTGRFRLSAVEPEKRITEDCRPSASYRRRPGWRPCRSSALFRALLVRFCSADPARG